MIHVKSIVSESMEKELLLSKYHIYQTFKKNLSVTINCPVSLHLSKKITNNDLITRID